MAETAKKWRDATAREGSVSRVRGEVREAPAAAAGEARGVTAGRLRRAYKPISGRRRVFPSERSGRGRRARQLWRFSPPGHPRDWLHAYPSFLYPCRGFTHKILTETRDFCVTHV